MNYVIFQYCINTSLLFDLAYLTDIISPDILFTADGTKVLT